MTGEYERKAIEAAMQQQLGMPEQEASKLAEFNEQQTDWFAQCQVCGAELKGNLKQMREHKCGR